jgi:hypothetical protein
VFQRLIEMIPGLEERLLEGSDESVVHIAELVSSYIYFDLSECSLSPDSEGCLKRKIR